MTHPATPLPPQPLREMVALIREDVRARRRHNRAQPWSNAAQGRLSLLLSPPVFGFVLYRCSHYFYRRGSRTLAWMCWVLQQLLTGMEITPESEFGPGIVVTNTAGVVIAGRFGSNVVIHARACVGGRVGSNQNDASRYGVPTIGDGVVLGECSLVVGPITVGAGAMIEAGALVLVDVPAGMGAAGHPAKVVERSEIRWPIVPGEALA